ncbi:hypothetical protein [Chitinimonas taiwanensis]|uniref:hypothetical protein n=1 Tax=Chitinimonas taiwanensis TaxID=240412 RepID=UPI0035AF5313
MTPDDDDTNYQIDSLKGMLTAADLREPRVSGISWMIEWQRDEWRPDWLCIGVAFQAGDVIHHMFATADDLTTMGMSPDDADHLLPLISAQIGRFNAGQRDPLPALRFTDGEPTGGQTVLAIMQDLWEDGPALRSEPLKKAEGQSVALGPEFDLENRKLAMKAKH